MRRNSTRENCGSCTQATGQEMSALEIGMLLLLGSFQWSASVFSMAAPTTLPPTDSPSTKAEPNASEAQQLQAPPALANPKPTLSQMLRDHTEAMDRQRKTTGMLISHLVSLNCSDSTPVRACLGPWKDHGRFCSFFCPSPVSFEADTVFLPLWETLDQKRKDVLESVSKVTESMVDGVNRGVARVFANQKKIEQVCQSASLRLLSSLRGTCASHEYSPNNRVFFPQRRRDCSRRTQPSSTSRLYNGIRWWPTWGMH